MIGSDTGYILNVSGDVPERQHLYFSDDGRAWHAVALTYPNPISTGDTFVAVTPGSEPGDAEPPRVHRFDGRSADDLRGYADDCGGCGGYVIGNSEPSWLALP